MDTSATTTSNCRHGISQCNVISWGCIHWYSKHVVHCLTVHPMSAFMLIQCTDSLIRSHVFPIFMWLLCSWSNIYFCNVKGMIIHFPFIATTSVIARLCHIGQYPPKLPFHCGRVATSLLAGAYNGLWSVLTFTSLAKQQWWNFSRP